MISCHYVTAQRRNFLREKAKVAGPFAGYEEARDAVIRLTPLYPDCDVRHERVSVANAKAIEAFAKPITERTTPL